MTSPLISVIIPVYNRAHDLKKTLQSIQKQTFRDFELIAVDDASSDGSAEAAGQFTDNVIINDSNKGPAFSRNRGIEHAAADIIACIDSDCTASDNWLKTVFSTLSDPETDAVMGNTSIPPSTFLGNSIACLGYPGGANAGFENMWKVDENGFTDHITSCNFAARKQVFDKHGMFDETFPMAGGEDSELSVRWSENGVKIRYCPDMKVYHKPITNLKYFMLWMIHRGRCAYHLKQRVGSVRGFVRQRVGSCMGIIRKNLLSLRIICIVPLIVMMFVLQQTGYMLELLRNK